MNPIFSGFQKMDIEHYSTQPTNCQYDMGMKLILYLVILVIFTKN